MGRCDGACERASERMLALLRLSAAAFATDSVTLLLSTSPPALLWRCLHTHARTQDEERAAWMALGLDDDAWPPGSGLFDGFGDDARSKSWADLTEEQQAAAELLGWNERSFTEDVRNNRLFEPFLDYM